MEDTFASTVPIDDESNLDEAKSMVLNGVNYLAREQGFAPTREQLILGTAFGIVEREDGTKLLQGTFTAS